MGLHEGDTVSDPFEIRQCLPRTFRPHRQRRLKIGDDSNKLRSFLTAENAVMEAGNTIETEALPREPLLARETLCLPDFAGDSVLHGGDERFQDVLRQYFHTAESNASEKLVNLKAKLRAASTHDFWGLLMEEMCDITGSQCGFVAKRMLLDDQDSAVEMPELGEPGSCLMGVAFYVNNGSDVKKMYRDYQYHAYGTPCAHMRHDKVVIIPERMGEFVPNNPNPMPWKTSEAFIGVPLFSEGKCFAHFGLIWSSEGAAKKKLGWNFIEMFMHSLEDLILQRIIEGKGFAKDHVPTKSTPAKVIPLSSITASQSLKPYARSLSHELRTPMQGVVGMLDIMYSTVRDAIASQQHGITRGVFEELRGHIEIVQDSSKRAVEAADNVVHAYDLNMQMPEDPLTPVDLDIHQISIEDGTNPSSLSPDSRKRKRTLESPLNLDPLPKRMLAMAEDKSSGDSYPTFPFNDGRSISSSDSGFFTASVPDIDLHVSVSDSKSSPIITPGMMSPTYRRIRTREFMRSLVSDALRAGHPTSEIHYETALGERIDVESLGSRGESQARTVHLNIETNVPDVIITEEQQLQFSLQKVIDNAIKFTETGSITISINLGKSSQVVEIRVTDTGCGISEESQASLFMPHFQEDASRSRSRDGLGLSLFNAKAHVRMNLGGDVTLERSATEGPTKGSEFLIRLPIAAHDVGDVPLVGTPTPTGTGQRKGSWAEPSTSFNYFLPEAMTFLPSTPARQFSPSRQNSRRRAIHNPNLAKEYPLRILIAEDNAINRNVAVGALNKLGYSTDNITLAFDGVEAVQHYKASLNDQCERFDVILMDIWMPNMDGYEATSRIIGLAREKGEQTTIVAITADITADSIERAKGAGMQGFLAKPYKVIDIENLIIEHFGRSC